MLSYKIDLADLPHLTDFEFRKKKLLPVSLIANKSKVMQNRIMVTAPESKQGDINGYSWNNAVCKHSFKILI